MFSSYVPTCCWIYVLMFVLEVELKSHAHAFVFMYVYAVNLVMVYHEWFMIVTWLYIMFFDLSVWEGWYDVSNESRLVLMIFWWLCCVDPLVRLMFSWWCLLTCKLILSTPRYKKTPCALMKYNMRQFAWRAKRLCWHHFQSCIKFVFKIDGFLGLWQDVAGKFFLHPL